MKEITRERINDPEKLEQLYRTDKNGFKSVLEELSGETGESELMRFWRVRLEYDQPAATSGKQRFTDILILIGVCFLTGFLIKIPTIFDIRNEIFYFRNAGMIVFGGLILYIVLNTKNPDFKKIIFVAGTILILSLYVNLLPGTGESDSITLVYIHLPLLMWAGFGLVYIDFDLRSSIRRIDFIKYNGDLAILMAIILIAGAILSGITIILFETIGIAIEEVYMENIGLVGAVSAPIVATYITRKFKFLTNKIAPIIANIFSPLVLITAVIFLVALVISGKNLFEDRDFLLIFNVMLLGVMAVIVFSVSESSSNRTGKFNSRILLILSVLTAIIDIIALSAIFYRLGTYGITPNRLAVLGSNILVLGNLVWLIKDLFKVSIGKGSFSVVESTVAKYLPVYIAWILFVVIAFPLIFGMM